jgi:hypothetical protein
MDTQSTVTWRSVLREQGRSLAWLAKRTETPPRTVYAYSIGDRRPPQEWLERVAVALDVPVSVFQQTDAA